MSLVSLVNSKDLPFRPTLGQLRLQTTNIFLFENFPPNWNFLALNNLLVIKASPIISVIAKLPISPKLSSMNNNVRI